MMSIRSKCEQLISDLERVKNAYDSQRRARDLEYRTGKLRELVDNTTDWWQKANVFREAGLLAKERLPSEEATAALLSHGNVLGHIEQDGYGGLATDQDFAVLTEKTETIRSRLSDETTAAWEKAKGERPLRNRPLLDAAKSIPGEGAKVAKLEPLYVRLETLSVHIPADISEWREWSGLCKQIKEESGKLTFMAGSSDIQDFLSNAVSGQGASYSDLTEDVRAFLSEHGLEKSLRVLLRGE